MADYTFEDGKQMKGKAETISWRMPYYGIDIKASYQIKPKMLLWSDRHDKHVKGYFRVEKLNKSIRIHFFRILLLIHY